MTSREVVSLEKYFEVRLDEQRAYLEARMESMEKATCEATQALNKRLEGMNEFRGALKDQTAQSLPRSEYRVQQEKVEQDIRELREYKAMVEGKASQQAVNIATIISVVSLLTGIISLILAWR